MKRHGANIFVGLCFALAASLVQAQAVDPALPVYTPVEGLQGKITMTGSATMSELAATWGDHFRALYPEVQIEVLVKGSANAVTTVISGESSFGLLSRQITETEVRGFHEKYGYLPTVLTPSLEPMAIFVHKDNPIEALSFEQLDAIFSTSLRRGAGKQATTWGDIGLAGAWATRPISVQLRSATTGSQVFFQTVILGGGEFVPNAPENRSNVDLITAISQNPGAIGFAGGTFDAPEIKAVPLAWKTGDKAIGIHEAEYPLVRPLQIVVNKDPQKSLSLVEQEFIKFVFSQQGQQDVITSGLVPVPSRPAEIALSAIGVKILN